MNILQNENLIIESKSSGTELTSIYSKKVKKIYYGVEITSIWKDDHQFYFL